MLSSNAAQPVSRLEQLIAESDEAGLLDYLRDHPELSQEELSTALAGAAYRGRQALVRQLLRRGADASYLPSMGLAAIHCAVEQLDEGMLCLLLKAGAEVNVATGIGWTPLHIAVDVEADSALQAEEQPSPQLTRLLLDAGADPLLREHQGRTAMDIAAQHDYTEACELLRAAMRPNL